MKKGVVHILESVLVSITFVMVVPFLLYPTMTETDWDYTQKILMGQDLMSSLDKINGTNESFLQDIMTINESALEKYMSNNFFWLKGKKVNYGIKTNGAIKKEIRVGFNCTACNPIQETERIEKILSPVKINGRDLTFRVFPFSYDDISSASLSSRYKMDVLFIDGINQRNDANGLTVPGKNNDRIDYLVESGVGVVGFYNMTPPTNVDTLETEIMGITNGAPGGGVTPSFMNSNNATKPNYEIQKYFYSVGLYENFTYKWNENNETTFKLWGNEYPVRRNNTNCGGEYCKLDISNDTDIVYEMLGYEVGDWFELDNGGTDFNFTIEKIDKNGTFLMINFERYPQYEFNNFAEGTPPQRPLRSDKDDSYEVVYIDGGRAGLIINGTRNSKYRTAWLSQGEGNDLYALVKSSVIWASKKEWWNVMRTANKEYTKVSYFVSQGEDFHEPYWVEIDLWDIY